jgi:hypothetical protein
VRAKLAGARYVTLETRKDGTKFTSRPLKEAAEKLQQLSGSYDELQRELVEQVGEGGGSVDPRCGAAGCAAELGCAGAGCCPGRGCCLQSPTFARPGRLLPCDL